MKSDTATATRRRAHSSAGLFDELIVDNFAGGGGASRGIEAAVGRAVDIAINHSRDAVKMHELNHPQTRHLCEDVWDVDPVKATGGKAVGVAWFSPDCRHFSRAKGGKPVQKRIRGLAWIVVKWAKAVRPRVIILENVREFQEWGPLTEDNRPCPNRKGDTFRRWRKQLENLGYQTDCRVLNAADFGAPTHRRRFFLIARCDGQPIRWPEPTHGPGRRPYRTAAECIDWSLPCPSIFLTKEEAKVLRVVRPLAEKTMRRIAMGLKRYVLDNPKPFIVTCNHGGPEFRGQPINEPMRTLTAARDAHGIVAPHLLKFRGEGNGASFEQPLPTITAGAGSIRPAGAAHAMGVSAPYLVEVQNGSSDIGHRSIDRPAHTVTANPKGGGVALAAPTLIQTGYGEREGQSPRALNLKKPLGTLVGSQKHALAAAFLAKHYGGNMTPGIPATQPVDTITAKDHHAVVASHLTKFYGTNTGADVREPMPTVTADGNHIGEVRAFLLRYYSSGGQTSAVNAPAPTVTTKDRLGVVTVAGQDYAIIDIGLRMLAPAELLRAQFGKYADGYKLIGTKSQQVAAIGNSVPPEMAEAVVRANWSEAESECAA